MLKRFLTTSLLLLLPIFAIGITIYYQSMINNRTFLEIQSVASLKGQNEQIINEFTHIVSDLMFLAEQQQLKTFLEKGGEHWQILAEEYRKFSALKKLYDQIRFLDETGMEVVRINFNADDSSIVPRSKLQSKGKRYYFLDTFVLEQGKVFISPFDLNIEKGEIEHPLKPMIRFGTPVFDSAGRKQGIILLNYLGANLLKKMEQKVKNASEYIMVLNAAGFWLKGITSEDEWGFMYKDGGFKTFGNRFSEEWQQIVQKESGQFYTKNGLFTFSTIYPLLEVQETSKDAQYATRLDSIEAKDYYWKMVSHIPIQILQKKSSQILKNMALPFMALFTLMMIISAFLTKLKMKHTEFLQNIINSLNHPFYVINAENYQIEFANAATRRWNKKITCYALTHQKSTPCEGINNPCPLQEVKRTKKHVVVEHLHFDENGDSIYVEVHGFPITDSAGNIIQMIEYSLDITERKRVEKQLIKQNQELRIKNAQLDAFTHQLKQQKNELRLLNKAYQRFVPCEFLKMLYKPSILDVQLGNQVEREMTVLFADIRAFTSISEKMTPQDNFDFINAYLSRMEPIICQHGGVIDKYIGDAIMALFPVNADDAVQAAINMLKSLADYNLTRGRTKRPKIKVGIGINTGSLMLGIVGSENRMDSTVISDTVNLASRIEEMTRIYGLSLLITMRTHEKLKDFSQYNMRLVDTVKVKGKDEVVTVYGVFDGDSPEMITLKNKTLPYFNKGIILYQKKAFKEAKTLFEKVLQANKDDKVAQLYLERCENFQKNGVPDDWEGIEVFENKC
ncbi:MAG: PAS domain-containing protein [Thiomargarita sp.]|nr:PAS domain-containing protein [Thiomargarita sp.]